MELHSWEHPGGCHTRVAWSPCASSTPVLGVSSLLLQLMPWKICWSDAAVRLCPLPLPGAWMRPPWGPFWSWPAFPLAQGFPAAPPLPVDEAFLVLRGGR